MSPVDVVFHLLQAHFLHHFLQWGVLTSPISSLTWVLTHYTTCYLMVEPPPGPSRCKGSPPKSPSRKSGLLVQRTGRTPLMSARLPPTYPRSSRGLSRFASPSGGFQQLPSTRHPFPLGPVLCRKRISLLQGDERISKRSYHNLLMLPPPPASATSFTPT